MNTWRHARKQGKSYAAEVEGGERRRARAGGVERLRRLFDVHHWQLELRQHEA